MNDLYLPSEDIKYIIYISNVSVAILKYDIYILPTDSEADVKPLGSTVTTKPSPNHVTKPPGKMSFRKPQLV